MMVNEIKDNRKIKTKIWKKGWWNSKRSMWMW